MKYLSISLFLIALVLISSCQEESPKSEAQIIKEVLATEKARREALNTNDISVVDQTMHEDYIFLTPNGMVVNKEGEMAGFTSGKTKFDSFKTDEVKVRVFGETAIVTGKATIEGNSDGHPISGVFRYTRIYYPTDGRWQIVSSHFSPVVESVAEELGE